MYNRYDIQSRAMLLHHCKSSGAINLTVHNIHIAPNSHHVLGEGRVLGAEEKAEIVSILDGDESQSFTLRSDRVLAKTAYALAWWIPKAEREILFRGTADEPSVISYKVVFPSVVGIYMRGQLFFAVTKGGKAARPDEDTPLFRIPLPNLSMSNTFCRGNAQIPAKASEANIEAWEAFLFETVNTHLGSARPLKGVVSNGDVIEAYAAAEKSGRFPTSRLLPMDTTLGDWMKSLDAGRTTA